MNPTDEQMMQRALTLARCGAGRVSPNPMVGAVITHGERIIGEGYHRQWGGPHAEVNAVRSVAEADRRLLPESTIYVTLEPCSHYGKTPPCASLLISEGFRRVVIGSLDPFEKVSGRGVAMLRDAGIDVEVGVLEQECLRLNRRFMTAHRLGRPYVQLKWAQSADGFMARRDGESVQLSTPVTRALMHRERSLADAIMVGTGTANLDNPRLNLRHWYGHDPLRVTFNRHGRLSNRFLETAGGNSLGNTCKERTGMADSGKTCSDRTLLSSSENPLGNRSLIIDREEPLSETLAHLYRDHGVTSLMVEGGPTLLRSFLAEGLFDEVRVETAPLLLHDGLEAPSLPGLHADSVETRNYQGNTLVRYLRNSF